MEMNNTLGPRLLPGHQGLGSKDATSRIICWSDAKACFAEWRRRARSRRDLIALAPRELSDLHLTRLDAMSEARQPFWKK
jgi:uncharacterized protein YjiS (DUF1127 family)